MSRVARVVVPGYPHHITQRGNRQAVVLEDDADRQVYLRLVFKYADLHGMSVLAYCLMPNHVHFVAVPQRGDSLALALHDAHTVYAMYFNTKTKLSGHVWQGRFYSCALDEPHLWAAVRYVERNPVRAGLVERAEQYPWSSAAAHCQLRFDPILSLDFPPSNVILNWSDWLLYEKDEEINRIRTQTNSGRPCGSANFLRHLQSLLPALLGRKKTGRPKKNPSASRLDKDSRL